MSAIVARSAVGAINPIATAYPLPADRRVGRIVVDHHALRREATDLLVLAEHGRELDRPHSSVLAERLSRLCERLRQHFALEEEGGYLHEIVAHRPDLQPRVAALLREHAVMLAEGDALTRHLLGARAPLDVMPRLVRLLEALRGHEVGEHEIFQQAFLDDLGGGD